MDSRYQCLIMMCAAQVPAFMTQGIFALGLSGSERLAPVSYGSITICQALISPETVLVAAL